VLVQVVDAAQRGRVPKLVAQVLHQVAQVVQQRGRHQLVVGAFGLGQRGRLQRMLQLGDGLAAVLLMALASGTGFRCRRCTASGVRG
jgi:hypothetical protein